MAWAAFPEAVVFDLDGTLIDSAPDLLAALDFVRADFGLPPGDHGQLREHVSKGAAGILAAGLPGWDELTDAERNNARDRLLDFYAEHCWVHSAPFEGIEALLGRLRGQGTRLGIVTNKISRFAEPVLERAGWARDFDCLVTGDRVERSKPDPEGLLAACRELGAQPGRAVFVGDDRRDVLAGAAAGVPTIVAAWGYVPADDSPDNWNADAVIARPEQLFDWLGARETG